MKEDKFEYSYLGKEQEEIMSEVSHIRLQYVKQGETKLQRLKKLDQQAKTPALVASLISGVGGCLVLGLGMAMIMEWNKMVCGIVVGVIGLIFVALAYPIYTKLFQMGQEKYGDEIIRLSEELMGENR